jgi:hypothetical protein
MKSLIKLFIILVWFIFLISLLATSLFAQEKKTQKEFDQIEPQATSSGNLFSSPIAPSKEEAGYPNPLMPPPLNIQEGPNTGG